MSAAEHVTAGEFERWMELLSQQNRDILGEQRKTNGRLTVLEIEHKVTKKIAAIISATIGTGIALIGLALQYWR